MVERVEEDVLLFALKLDQVTLSNTFPGFAVKDGFVVPLGELCRQLDLAIVADPSKGRAEGYFIEERRHFQLDALAGTVLIEGVKKAVDRSRIEIHSDDIYVDTRLLAEWLPIDLKVAPRAAEITVLPREPLPLQARWKREQESGRHPAGPAAKAYSRVQDPYQLFELPFVDESLRILARSDSGGDHRFRAQSTTFASGDLLYLSTSVYGTLDNHDGLSEFRMTMGRRDPNAGLLGGLHATEFAFGEVLNPGVNLLSLPAAGTGALLTNFPLQRADAFDRHSFQGDLPAGWQVELYRNQALVAFQAARPDGRYEFLSVPLYYGWNDFRLVFYGPQGQRREEVARFDVSESQTPAGDFQYRLVGDDPRAAGARGQFEGRYGISKQFSTTFALARVDLDGVRHTYTEAGLQGFWTHFSSTLTAGRDAAGGSIEELGMRTRLGSVSLTGLRSELQGGFVSEVFRPIYGPIKNRSTLEASALLPSLERAWFTVDLGASEDQLVAGGAVDRLYNRLSTSYRGYFVSNQITLTEGHGGSVAIPATTTGDLLASKFFRNVSLRGQASYQLSGGRQLRDLSLTAETPSLEPFLLRAGITRTIANRETQYQVGADKNQGAFSLGLNLSYSTRTHWMADFTLRIGLGREPRQGAWHTQAQSMASYGAVSAQAFVDGNGNGVKDPGERAVEGAGFMVNGAGQPRTTNAQGVALLNNLSGELDANLSLAPSSLEDPLMRPATPGVRMTPRPGHVLKVDFPIIVFGEVTGTAYQKKDGLSQELPGLKLELVDAKGQVLKTVRTAFDGFYDLTDLAPGDYQVRVSEEEAARLTVLKTPARGVHITADGTVIDGLDFVLERLEEPKPPAATEVSPEIGVPIPDEPAPTRLLARWNAIARGDWESAFQSSNEDLAAVGTAWSLRVRAEALSSSLLAALSRFPEPEPDWYLQRPGRRERHLRILVGHFQTRRLAERYRASLPRTSRKALGSIQVVRIGKPAAPRKRPPSAPKGDVRSSTAKGTP